MEEVSSSGVVSTPLSYLKRVSWPAVFAGVVLALAVQLLLSLLGLAIGASTIDPLQEQDPMRGIGIGSSIWFAVTTIVALGVGGWAAGRLAGISKKVEAALHGLLTWGFTTLLLFYFVNSVIGGLISGAAGVVGRGMELVGGGLQTLSPDVASQMENGGLDLSAISNDARQLLRDRPPQPSEDVSVPSDMSPGAAAAGSSSQQNPVATEPAAPRVPGGGQAMTADLDALINRIFSSGNRNLPAADRDSLVNSLIARTNLSPEEANARVDQWQAMALASQDKLEAVRVAAAQKAREVADRAAKGIARAALLSFVALIIGAFAAAFGAIRGMPKGFLVFRRGESEDFGMPGVEHPVH